MFWSTGSEVAEMAVGSDFVVFEAAFLAVPAVAVLVAAFGPAALRRRQERRLVVSVERALGHRGDRVHWARIATATVAAWCLAVATLIGVSPSLAVWVGGAVVTVGVVVLVRVWGDPHRLDDLEFDRRLREMLDQG